MSKPTKQDFTLFIAKRAKGEKPQPIHCINCGRLMLETGKTILAVDDAVNLDDADRDGKATVIMCKRCKSKVTVI